MPKIKQTNIKCGACGVEFPSPIFLENSESFETALAGAAGRCPSCRKITIFNRENVSFVFE